MARPKTLRKPSKQRLEREERRRKKRDLRRRPRFFYAGSDVGCVDYAGTASANEAVQVDWPACTDFIAPVGPSFPDVNVHLVPTNGATAAGTRNTGTAWHEVATVNDTGGNLLEPGWTIEYTRQVGIESLDEGVTWHTADTLEPAVNQNGQLVIGVEPSGPAPEIMRPGSGTYRFEITIRRPTAEEARNWFADYTHARELERAPWEERVRKNRSATERAQDLLLLHLSPDQRRDFEEFDGFWVRSQHGNRYWVTKYSAVRFDGRGVALQCYCIHAVDHDIPGEDNAVMRKLLLECDEDEFLRTANPRPPGPWEVERRRRAPMIQYEALTPEVLTPTVTRVVQNGELVDRDPLAGRRPVVSLPLFPVLLNVNGVVRPLTA